MALLEDVFGNGVGGPAAVVGAVVLGSLLLPAVAGAARPVVKKVIQGGINGLRAVARGVGRSRPDRERDRSRGEGRA
jgi:hypothetical protein